jgi:hypothetical protein
MNELFKNRDQKKKPCGAVVRNKPMTCRYTNSFSKRNEKNNGSAL